MIQPQKSTKYTKITIYILEYQIVLGVRNINLDFLQDHQDLSQKVLFFPSIEPDLKYQGNTHNKMRWASS